MIFKLQKTAAMIGSVILLSGCLTKEDVHPVYDAENILFTSSGRLFVTGHTDVMEIQQVAVSLENPTGFKATTLAFSPPIDSNSDLRCFFSGIAEQNGWLFSVCKALDITEIDPDNPNSILYSATLDNRIYAAKIETNAESMRLVRLDPVERDSFDQLALPNGAAFSPAGDLLVADERFYFSETSPDTPRPGGVTKVNIEYNATGPYIDSYQIDWIGHGHGISSANGVRVADNALYLSEHNNVWRFDFDENGNVPTHLPTTQGQAVQNRKEVWHRNDTATIIDDLMPVCGGVAFTDFIYGRLVYVKPLNTTDALGRPNYKQKYITLPLNYSFPSSIAVGQGPMFSGDELLVTEKGLINVNDPNNGNQLVRSPLNMDLNTAAGCAKLNNG